MPFTGIVDACVNDTADTDMETIDLSDKPKLEESCVIVDNELLYAVSCRPRKFRSYKVLSLSLCVLYFFWGVVWWVVYLCAA